MNPITPTIRERAREEFVKRFGAAGPVDNAFYDLLDWLITLTQEETRTSIDRELSYSKYILKNGLRNLDAGIPEGRKEVERGMEELERIGATITRPLTDS